MSASNALSEAPSISASNNAAASQVAVTSASKTCGRVAAVPARVVSREEWLNERRALLAKEKAHTREYDRLRAERLKLPWVRVEENYVFEGPSGRETLSDLFAGKSQLMVYHFMLGPGWEEGCKGCSFVADHLEGPIRHITHHDVSVVVVSRAPLAEIEAFRKRMGWNFKWVSSHGSDFNFDYHVSFTPEQQAQDKNFYNYEWKEEVIDELPGASAFAKDAEGGLYHTYSVYSRGLEPLVGAYAILDMAPKGRNEPDTGTMGDWMRHHDRYEDAKAAACCGEAAESAAVPAVKPATGCGCPQGAEKEDAT